MRSARETTGRGQHSTLDDHAADLGTGRTAVNWTGASDDGRPPSAIVPGSRTRLLERHQLPERCPLHDVGGRLRSKQIRPRPSRGPSCEHPLRCPDIDATVWRTPRASADRRHCRPKPHGKSLVERAQEAVPCPGSATARGISIMTPGENSRETRPRGGELLVVRAFAFSAPFRPCRASSNV